MDLDTFNHLDNVAAAEVAGVWAAVPSWVSEIVASRPYASVEDAAEKAADAATAWTTADLDAALAHHPRIGERVAGVGTEALASRSEQHSMSSASASVAEAMTTANAAYEERFARVFLIRAAGRSPEEMLAEVTRRLDNSDDDEAREALDQLAQIALLRLRTDLASKESQ